MNLIIKVGILFIPASVAFAAVSISTDHFAQSAHEKGQCGSMGIGTGLSGNKGWIVSMLPGKHELRVRGGSGRVFLTAAKQSILDFDAGRPYYVVVEGAGPAPVLEWKLPGSDWSVVSKYFLYPVKK